MASWLRRHRAIVALIGIALVLLLLVVLRPDLELIFVILAIVVVVGLFAHALELTRGRK